MWNGANAETLAIARLTSGVITHWILEMWAAMNYSVPHSIDVGRRTDHLSHYRSTNCLTDPE